MEFLKSSHDCLLEDNEDGSYTVCIIKPWAVIERIYLDDNTYQEYPFDNFEEAEEFYNWVVESDDDYNGIVDTANDCCA